MTSDLKKDDVQRKKPDFFLKTLKKEISIRNSLILFYILLITLVSLIIIVVNQQIINRVLTTLTKQIMFQVALTTENEIENQLKPLTMEVNDAIDYFTGNIITPGSSYSFKLYLLKLVNSSPQIDAAYWATPQGDFFGVHRETNNLFHVWNIERSKKNPEAYQGIMNSHGQLYDIKKASDETYDPRVRAWYLAAIQNKQTWTDVYKFALFKYQNSVPYGFTTAKAVYDKKNGLRGVFGIDVTINELIRIIQKIYISPNSSILITDKNNRLIATNKALDPQQYIKYKVNKDLLKSLKIPDQFTSLFSKEPQAGQTYMFSTMENYFIVQDILKFGNQNNWMITILVPKNDILGPLRWAGFISLISALIILILGILIANIISRRITKPILRIVNEAEAIRKLELDHVSVHSYFTEIQTLNLAFEAMKKGLQSFGRYVPSLLIKKLFASGKVAHVGGEMKTLTVLFIDIRNFTALTEKINPTKVMKFLYEYLDSMTKIIYDNHGTIDKYVGDMIVAFWGAPLDDDNQADHACICTLKMFEALKTLNKQWTEEGLDEISTRAGINTGPAIVGNVGSSERLNYTALGDSVNLASRLEEINKIYGTRIIITENTFKRLKSNIPVRMIDYVAVRGKQEGVKIFELEPLFFNNEELIIYNKIFKQAFNLYQNSHFEDAIKLFGALSQQFTHDKISKIFIQRCKDLIIKNPKNWDGIWRFE